MHFFLYRKGDVTVLVNSLVGVARAQHASVLYLINGILLLTLQWPRVWPHCSVGKLLYVQILVCPLCRLPASSAPVERVISQSGLMMHPNRPRMSDKVFEELLFSLTNDI